MDDIKREEVEKACKKEDSKIRIRMVTIRMVLVRNMTVEEPQIFGDAAQIWSTTGCAVTKESWRPPESSKMQAEQKNYTGHHGGHYYKRDRLSHDSHSAACVRECAGHHVGNHCVRKSLKAQCAWNLSGSPR